MHARLAWCAAATCAAAAVYGCGAPISTSMSDDQPPTGYVMLEAPAREQAWLQVEGFCFPLTAELAEPIETGDSATLVGFDDTRSVLEVVPDRVLVVHDLEQAPEAFEIDPDRAILRATEPNAVAWLAERIFAGATELGPEADDAERVRYALGGPGVWAKAERALEQPEPDFAEGIESLHPLPFDENR